ncbi:Gfo/Idh/MocA family oxidoreductase [Kordia sp. YSTF-M3]|uniref:Gfo/Idh/MocA family oxidoreductase n=1 Tax=Kordia aestuariivivens TaxID=2759037 RepID=A0ABR7Q495_9FLAO|nr:Gfo/Idh/MocA family oxidoreductase [Kordia aestuariivivens]MBC8753263.1 Gfo/Idh/MocA family oxidoreductase [Kordia aestuariivivens]
MHKKIHWGIIGLGNIAHKFAADLQLSDNVMLQGVASRNLEKATEFASTYNAVTAYDSYEKLANDPKIDVIYIATPHTFHFENTMLCLQNGKAVLCEKPMGINSTQVKTMIQEAKSRKLFLMEAVWTRFMPAIEKMISLLDEETIGDIIQIRADFGFKAELNLESRLFNKKLGGGSLLDIGIYPIFLSLLVSGIPTDIKTMARMTETDVDSFCALLFDYSTNAKAVLESTFEANTPTEAYIHGTKGAIKLHRRFHQPTTITLFKDDSETVFELPYTGNGYIHEIEEVNSCLRNGQTESSKLPLEFSQNLITIIDTIKTQIGLNYIADAE